MPADDVTKIRSVAIVGQGGTGKTTVADALLFAAGAASRIGRVDDGSSAFDTEPEEARRKTSITGAVHHAGWKKHEVNIIDTPGYSAFLHDTRNCLGAATGVVVVLGSTGGEVKVEIEKVWAWCEELGLPRIGFVTRLDRERASLEHALADVATLGAKPAVLQVPIGIEGEFRGVVDVLSGRAFLYQGDSGTFQEGAAPAELADAIAKARELLVEAIAEANDPLLEKYLEGNELTPDELRAGLHDATRAGRLLPILCGSGARAVGLHPLLDAIVDLLPSAAELPAWKGDNPKTGEQIERAADPAAPFSAFCFKTIVDPFAGKLSVLRVVSGHTSPDLSCVNASRETRERIGHPLKLEGKKQTQVSSVLPGDIIAVAKLKDTQTGDTLADEKHPIIFPLLPDAPAAISFALQPKSKADDEKVMQGLHRLMEEDTALRVHRDEQTKEFVISGTGQLHVEVAVERLKRKFGVEVELKAPKVPYKETIRGTAKAQGKHKRQTGGHGQYGDAWMELSPLPRGGGFEFEDAVVGGVIPRNFIPAVEKGVRELLPLGLLAGYPIVDVKVKLYDGSYHDVDSSEMSFKIAAHLGFKKAFEMCKPVLLEPIMTISVTVPDEHMGDVIGDLNSRRGKVLGAETKGHAQVIRAHVPMAEVLRYAPDLRSMTSGRGDFALEFSHYEEVPPHLAERIVKEAQAAKAERNAWDPAFEAACDTIVRAVEAGKDGIAVPAELLVEAQAEQPEKAIPQSLFAQIVEMGVHEKIKLAMRGNKDARTILMRDPIRLVRRCVLQNPRITDGEVIAIARNRSADEELLRMINEKREWVRNYQVRHALSTNPKTPLPVAMRHVATLAERDLRTIAKSKNVPQAVAVQARRMLEQAGKGV